MLRVLLVTAPKEKAPGLARALLKERLIACANLIPGATSLFWWQGKIDTARETLLVLKAPARNVRKLLSRIPALHPYEVPEVLVLHVPEAFKPYAVWVESETKQNARKR